MNNIETVLIPELLGIVLLFTGVNDIRKALSGKNKDYQRVLIGIGIAFLGCMLLMFTAPNLQHTFKLMDKKYLYDKVDLLINIATEPDWSIGGKFMTIIISIITIILSSAGGFFSSYFLNFLNKREESKSILSLENSYSEIKNIGYTTAINVSIFRVLPDKSNSDKSNIYWYVSLLENLISIKKDETMTLNNQYIPIGHDDFYIIQFYCLNGLYYHQVFDITTGRGDSECLNLPVSVNKKKLFPTYSIDKNANLLKIPKKTIKSSSRLKNIK